MKPIYKVPYRRYGVQMPISLADEIDEEAKRSMRSASQVIVSYVQRGMIGYGSVSTEQIDRWKRDERAIIAGSKAALAILHGAPAERMQHARELALLVLHASLRQPANEEAQAAEARGSYEPPNSANQTSGAGPRDQVPKTA